MKHRLMLKHFTNGKKYLCKTVREDWQSYMGSGNKVRNSDLVLEKTELLGEFQTKEELKNAGLYYSKLWDVIGNEEFLNETVEEGQGGNTGIDHPTRGINISKALTGRKFSEEHKLNISKFHADVSGINNPMFGKKRIHKKKECPSCLMMIGVNNFSRHLPRCSEGKK